MKSKSDLPANEEQARLYQKLARRLFNELAAGRYAVGDRLPAERDLALEHSVSRPTVREALIALEAQGFIEVRVGSGAYVSSLPGQKDTPSFHVTAFELTEARLVIEGEAAALAAIHISDAELDDLDRLVGLMADENLRSDGSEQADQEFHATIARATRNAAIERTVKDLWSMRASSPETALLLAKARTAKVQPVVEEHRIVVDALRSRDPRQARAAMRQHLKAVLDHLLFATEEAAVQKAREAIKHTRNRFAASGMA
jgi:DNA-binding FadR family transcriptional regulator